MRWTDSTLTKNTSLRRYILILLLITIKLNYKNPKLRSAHSLGEGALNTWQLLMVSSHHSDRMHHTITTENIHGYKTCTTVVNECYEKFTNTILKNYKVKLQNKTLIIVKVIRIRVHVLSWYDVCLDRLNRVK